MAASPPQTKDSHPSPHRRVQNSGAMPLSGTMPIEGAMPIGGAMLSHTGEVIHIEWHDAVSRVTCPRRRRRSPGGLTKTRGHMGSALWRTLNRLQQSWYASVRRYAMVTPCLCVALCHSARCAERRRNAATKALCQYVAFCQKVVPTTQGSTDW